MTEPAADPAPAPLPPTIQQLEKRLAALEKALAEVPTAADRDSLQQELRGLERSLKKLRLESPAPEDPPPKPKRLPIPITPDDDPFIDLGDLF